MSKQSAAGLKRLQGMAKAHYNASQPRDANGRWTHGDSNSPAMMLPGLGGSTSSQGSAASAEAIKLAHELIGKQGKTASKATAKTATSQAPKASPSPPKPPTKAATPTLPPPPPVPKPSTGKLVDDLPPKFKDQKHAEIWLRERLPHMEVSFNGMDMKCIEAVTREYAALSDDYPEVAKRMLYLGTQRPPWSQLTPDILEHWKPDKTGGLNLGSAVGWAGTEASGGYQITLNPSFYGDFNGMEKMNQEHQRDGWSAKNNASAPASVLAHEFGHQVGFWIMDKALEDKNLGAMYDSVNAVLRTTPVVSNYAKTNFNEAFAESFLLDRHGNPAEDEETQFWSTAQKMMLEAIRDSGNGAFDAGKVIDGHTDGMLAMRLRNSFRSNLQDLLSY